MEHTLWEVKCERCGQVAICAIQSARLVCDACHELERQPQGEAMALFTPAPTPMAGQTTMDAPTIYSSWMRPWTR